MGFRTIVRKVSKPAAMALVAGSLALSLTVTTTTRAEATPAVAVLPVIAAAESVLAGGVSLTMPSLLALSLATNPVGWAVGIGAVGVGLWATKDYWLPWVQDPLGQWGKAIGGSPLVDLANPSDGIGPALMASSANLSVSNLRPDPANPRKSLVDWNYSGSSTASNYLVVEFRALCKKTDGTFSYGGSLANPTITFKSTLKTGTAAPTGDLCTTGTAVGFWAGPMRAGVSHAFVGNASAYTPATSTATWGQQTVSGGAGSAPAFDPKGADVKYRTTVECIDAAGTRAELSAESAGDEGGVKVPSCAAAGLGHGTGKMSVEGYAPTAPAVPGTAPTPLWSAPAPTVAPDHPQRLCDPNRPGDGCKMAITIDGKPCVVGSWDCENWTEIWKDPNTAPRVGCTYGPYTMAVDLCTVMEPAYRPGGAPATDANIDGNPSTRNYTQPGGTTYAPPSTGTGTVPGLGGQPGPGSSPEEAGCFPTGWAALNPVEWVMKPVGCALTAAFVPKPEVVQAQQTRIQTKLQNVGFARITDAWLSTFESVGGGGGCAGPTVNFSMNGVSQSLQPFNACSAPMSTVAGITYAVSAIGIVLFGGLGMIRAVGSAFGFNFTLGKGASE